MMWTAALAGVTGLGASGNSAAIVAWGRGCPAGRAALLACTGEMAVIDDMR